MMTFSGKSSSELIKESSILSIALCVALTIGYVLGGGDFSGPNVVVYFVLLVICIGLAVGMVLESNDQ